jgi:thiosulfate dehydrogenase (quinone) large subunit
MKVQQWSVAALRIILGWYMFADGYVNLMTPGFTSKGFLLGAKTFAPFYHWFALPNNLVWVDPLNVWGIILIGVALLLGIAVRPAAWAGVLMMIVYYFPHYAYPFHLDHGWIVEEHVVLAAGFLVVAVSPFAEYLGLGAWARRSFLARIPLLRSLL